MKTCKYHMIYSGRTKQQICQGLLVKKIRIPYSGIEYLQKIVIKLENLGKQEPLYESGSSKWLESK